MPGFSTSLSGLNANSTALATIANNLANMNTVADKSMRPLLRDSFYLQVGPAGSGNPPQVGVGAAVGSIDSLFIQGIACEFAQLILAQRGFQANARAFRSIDEVAQEASNLKR